MEYPGIEINSDFIRGNVFMLTNAMAAGRSYSHSFLLESF